MRAFLEDGHFKAFTTTFEDLHGLAQLPGLAVQRLMADGYGFGAEGDWKTAALVRAMKVMGSGLAGGTSFMEDYTYDFDEKSPKVLGCPHARSVCIHCRDRNLRWKFIRFRSAARQIRPGWCSLSATVRRSMPR